MKWLPITFTCLFSHLSDVAHSQKVGAETEDTTLLVVYAGNLLRLPNLTATSSSTGSHHHHPSDGGSSALAGFFGFGGQKAAISMGKYVSGGEN